MITIGVDAHKRVRVALALDEAGREISHWQGENSRAGWNDLQRWALSVGTARQWGIENAWGYGRGLAQHLVASGEDVYDATLVGRRCADAALAGLRRPIVSMLAPSHSSCDRNHRASLKSRPMTRQRCWTCSQSNATQRSPRPRGYATRFTHCLCSSIRSTSLDCPPSSRAPGWPPSKPTPAPTTAHCLWHAPRPYAGWRSASGWLSVRRKNWPSRLKMPPLASHR